MEINVRDFDLRRAILVVLLAADCELSSSDVVDRLHAVHGIDLDGRQKVSSRRRVSDTLDRLSGVAGAGVCAAIDILRCRRQCHRQKCRSVAGGRLTGGDHVVERCGVEADTVPGNDVCDWYP